MKFQEITSDKTVFEALGMTEDQRPDFSKCREKDQKALNALYMMELAIEAINGPEFTADLTDFDQLKVALYPYIDQDDTDLSGFRFSSDDWTSTCTYTSVGARRLFETRAKAKHFWDHFKHYFIAYTIGNK